MQPQNFSIKAGKSYYVNHSGTSGPFRVKAVADGLLRFSRPAEVRNTFCVVSDLPNLISRPLSPLVVGKKSNADVKRRSIAVVPVQPGKRYRGSFFYSQLSGTPNAAVGLELRLKRDGKQIAHINNRYLYSFPLLKAAPDSPRYCLDEISVPAAKGKYELELSVELSGAPGEFRITSPEVTVAPPRLWHRGKYSNGTLFGDPVKGAQIMAKYPPLNTEIRMVNGIPRVFCNGEIQTLVPVQAGSDEQIKAAAAAGVQIMMVTLPVNNWGRKQGSVWVSKDKYDWSVVDKKLARIAELAPQTKIMLLCYDLAYPGFGKEHPEICWVTGDGRSLINFCSAPPAVAFSYAGETARNICGRFLYDLGRHLASTPLGNRVISIHLSAGSDGQWYQPERPWNFKKLDYSDSSRRAVIRQLKRLYNNDLAALKKAWGMPQATFDDLQTPSPQELASPDFLLNVNDPRHRRLIDWINADQLALIDAIDHYAARFKAGFGRKVLVTTYAPGNRFINKTALFRTKNLDGTVYLSSYLRPRSSGGDGGNSYPIASAALHGKIILEEVDYRNEYFGYNGTNRSALIAMADDDAGYMGQLMRAFGANWSRGGSGWLRPINQDSYLAWTGFYQRHMRAVKKAALAYLAKGKVENYADVIHFAADDYQMQMSRRNNFDHMMAYVASGKLGLAYSGFSHRNYLLSDLRHPRRAKGKIYIFSGASGISPADVDYICKNLQKDGNVLIFSNDVGRNNPAGFSATLKKLTGIDAVLDPNKMVDGIYSTRIVNSLGIRDIPGMSVWVRKLELPQITIAAEGTERIADLPSGLPGAVLKRHRNWSAIYIAGVPKNLMTPDFWRLTAELAGISRTLPAGDVSYSGNGIRLIHAVTDGKKPVNGKLELDMKYGESKLIFKDGSSLL